MRHYTRAEWFLYVENRVENREREAMEQHLGVCDECLSSYLSILLPEDIKAAGKKISTDFAQETVKKAVRNLAGTKADNPNQKTTPTAGLKTSRSTVTKTVQKTPERKSQQISQAAPKNALKGALQNDSQRASQKVLQIAPQKPQKVTKKVPQKAAQNSGSNPLNLLQYYAVAAVITVLLMSGGWFGLLTENLPQVEEKISYNWSEKIMNKFSSEIDEITGARRAMNEEK